MKQSIIILLASLLFMSLTSNSMQDFEVRGVVTAATSGVPLAGVNIQVLGSKKASVSDSNGAYQLLLAADEKVLIFSYTGYTSQRIKVDSRKVINVQLQQEGQLNEVVIQESEQSDQSRLQNAAYSKARQYAVSGVYHGIPAPYVQPDWNTEDYDFIKENSFISMADQSTSTFSIDVDRASYSNMRRFILQGMIPPPDAIRIEELINYFDYDYPQPQKDPVAIYTELGSCPWQPAHQLLQIGVQSKKLALENLVASNLVFLIDVSGSMQAENKLPLLISSFGLLAGELRPQDRVSIVTYAGSSEVVLEGKSGRYKSEIIGALTELQAGGSTAGAKGILTAYDLAKRYFIEGGNNRVILATDGDFNIGISSDGDLVRLIEQQRESGVFLSVLGFGMGNYKDNKMQKLADHGNGNHNYIDNLTEAKKVFVHEFGGSLYTVAKDVKIQIEFNPAKVAGYRLVGYENRKLDNRDFADDKKDAGEIGTGHTVTALYEIIPAGQESIWIINTDKRYQSTPGKPLSVFSEELAYVRLRYKDPDGLESKLMEQPVLAAARKSNLSENFNWAAAVACFGMLLRDSEFKQETTLDLVRNMAEQNKGKDEFGYRAEFIYLLNKFRDINKPLLSDEAKSNR